MRIKFYLLSGLFFAALSIFSFGISAEEKSEGIQPEASGKVSTWSPFIKTNYRGAYVSVIIRKKSDGKRYFELWHNTWGETAADRKVVVRRGESFDKLGPEEEVLNGEIINDVFAESGKLAPGRAFTRPQVNYYDDIGYVMLACVCDKYPPGKEGVVGALAVSKTGKKGTWRYLGKLKGEPYEISSKKGIWSSGGAIIRMGKSKWRIYLAGGYTWSLCALEGDSLEGDWKFIRDEKGKIKDLAEVITTGEQKMPRPPPIFPFVLKLSDTDWHLWASDQWLPTAIYHLYSKDGLDWKVYGKQPEITRKTIGGKAIKCLRPYYDASDNTVNGLLSGWNGPEWQLYWGKMRF